MARVQYNFPYPVKDSDLVASKLGKQISDTLLEAISKVKPGDKIDELTIKILGVVSPVADDDPLDKGQLSIGDEVIAVIADTYL